MASVKLLGVEVSAGNRSGGWRSRLLWRTGPFRNYPCCTIACDLGDAFSNYCLWCLCFVDKPVSISCRLFMYMYLFCDAMRVLTSRAMQLLQRPHRWSGRSGVRSSGQRVVEVKQHLKKMGASGSAVWGPNGSVQHRSSNGSEKRPSKPRCMTDSPYKICEQKYIQTQTSNEDVHRTKVLEGSPRPHVRSAPASTPQPHLVVLGWCEIHVDVRFDDGNGFGRLALASERRRVGFPPCAAVVTVGHCSSDQRVLLATT